MSGGTILVAEGDHRPSWERLEVHGLWELHNEHDTDVHPDAPSSRSFHMPPA